MREIRRHARFSSQAVRLTLPLARLGTTSPRNGQPRKLATLIRGFCFVFPFLLFFPAINQEKRLATPFFGANPQR